MGLEYRRCAPPTGAHDRSSASVDGGLLVQHAKAANRISQAALRAELTRRLGVGWERRDERWEVRGVPPGLCREWSKRRSQITAARGRVPSSVTRVSPSDRIRGEIDALFAADRDLAEVLEDVARLGARLLLQTALEAEITEFLGRDRYARGRSRPRRAHPERHSRRGAAHGAATSPAISSATDRAQPAAPRRHDRP